MYKIIISFIIFLFAIPAIAQDAHYWNIQYGTRSTLLGGAVIGSVSDLSATYYNPGAVALFEDTKFILSARVYQLETITVEDGAGNGRDLDYWCRPLWNDCFSTFVARRQRQAFCPGRPTRGASSKV